MLVLDKPEALVDSETPMNKGDRCDTCGAEARVRAVVNGTALVYCGHHATKYETRLRQVATSFHDERHLLEVRA